MPSFVSNGIKFCALLIGVSSAIVIALLTGVLGPLELCVFWPLGLLIMPIFNLIMGFLEEKSTDPVFALTRKALQSPLMFGRVGQEVFISWIWFLARRTSGSRVETDISKCRSHYSTEPESYPQPVVVIGPHPTMEAATALSKGLMSHFYGPVRWAIKWELMLWFAPVILPFLAAGAGYPLVRESKTLSRWVLRWLGTIHSGVAAIFPDGTRPAEGKGKAARRWLQDHGQAEAAAQWILPLALPRPGGLATLLAANPTARVVLAVTCGGVPGRSVPADFWRLVFGPRQTYEVTLIDLDRAALDEAATESDAALGRLLVHLWLEKVFPLLREGGMQPMEIEE